MVDMPCEMLPPPSAAITISEACPREFEALKTRSSYDYITFKYDRSTNSITIDKFGSPGSSYEQFLADLPEKEPCYAVKRITCTQNNGTVRNLIIFVLWCPDQSPIKLKMIIASHKASFRQVVKGIDCEIGSTDLSEIALDVVLARLRNL